MESTQRLRLPLLSPGQAQKEMTHNEALAVIVPRAMREPADEQPRSVPGAKGMTPVDAVVEERIVTETGATSIDSISWDTIDSAGRPSRSPPSATKWRSPAACSPRG